MKRKDGIIVDKNGVTRVPARPWHHYRKAILEENLLEYADKVNMMERDKALVKDYTTGAKYTELGERYGISHKSVPGTISRFVRKARTIKKNMMLSQ